MSPQVTMVSRDQVPSLTCKVTGVILGIELPFNGCPLDACTAMATGDCPTEEGEVLVYDIDIEVLAAYPAVELLARWQLLTPGDQDFICFEVPIRIEA